jgi:hypothetical protein
MIAMRCVALLGLLLWPGGAGADEVFIRGGGHLSGDIVERGPDSITIDIGTGRIGLLLSSVERIVPSATPMGLFRERAASLDPGDLAGWLALGRWARAQGLETNAREAFEHVLAFDPEHAAAHRAMGHVELEGRWMTEAESYRVRGYVPFEGDWVTPGARQEILEWRRATAEDRRADAEAAARVREAEARARAAEAEARRAEAELQRVEADGVEPSGFDGGGWTPWYAGFYPAFASGFYPVFRPHFHSAFRSRGRGFGSFQPFPTMISARTRVPIRTRSGVPRAVHRPTISGRHFSKRGK